MFWGANVFIIKRRKKNTVVIFYPHVKSDPKGKMYPQYCKYALLKFKLWTTGGDAGMHPFGGIDNPTDEDYVLLWNSFLESCQKDGR